MDIPITIVQVEEVSGLGQWSPQVGSELLEFLERVPDTSRQEVRKSALRIMMRCTDPKAPCGARTGLVTGYVQSGKTMSFESVAALARDNGYAVVIVIGGMANHLLAQSAQRLRRDLGVDDLSRPRRWVHLNNPQARDTDLKTVRDLIAESRDQQTPESAKRTLLITVLKHHGHLKHLVDLLGAAPCESAPTLIIDDEADQASLNNEVQRGDESTTYSRLMELRACLGNHTYLQYTATPQAPLLVSIADTLSPDFVEVLNPGSGYVGGSEFFAEGSNFVVAIPSQDVPSKTNVLTDPPESLIAALQDFIIGVAAGLIDRPVGNRSMLVHPSHRTMQHSEYYRWVHSITEEWRRIMELPESELDRLDLVEDFQRSYARLARTMPDGSATFEQVVECLPRAFRNIRVLEVNAALGKTPTVDWAAAYGWILVGGQAMDRGFTIEGLTVTYMPRGAGSANADTLQQRARFFGYKRPYIGYCRAYLEQTTLDLMRNYVEHEEDIRTQLQVLQQASSPLARWKRAFILDPRLSPCRQAVLQFEYMRGRYSEDWWSPRVVFTPDEITSLNRELVARFQSRWSYVEDEGHPNRDAYQRHHVAKPDIPLSVILEELLTPFRVVAATDTNRLTGLLLQLSRALESGDDTGDPGCRLYVMSPSVRRTRGVDAHGTITNLFMGQAPVNPPVRRGEIYPGDRKIRVDDKLTVQIHWLDLEHDRSVVSTRVPVLAVWVPKSLGAGWIVQEQPGQYDAVD